MRKTLYSHTHKQPWALVCPEDTRERPRKKCVIYHTWLRNLSYKEAKHRASILTRKYKLPKDCEVVPAWRVTQNPSEVYFNHYSQDFDMAYYLCNSKHGISTTYPEDYYVIHWCAKGPVKMPISVWLTLVKNRVPIQT